jgi:hypothetical protein
MTVLDDRPVLEDREAIDEAHAPRGIIRTMSEEGDTGVTWTPGNATEERVAREHFDTMRGKGYAAYRVERDDEGEITDREIIRKFDATLGEVVMVPPRQGG